MVGASNSISTGSSSEGKTVKDGATWASFNFNDTTTEAALQGKKAAMKTDEGWKSVDEVLSNSEPGPGQFMARVKGTGLGLYIVRSVIEKHGGKVEVSSAGPNQGSTFTIRLPRAYA